VREQLVIDRGPTIRLDDGPPQGTRHTIRFGVLADRDEPVVVKVERIPAALERERAALAWLGAARPRLAPRLIAFGQATLAGDRVVCLVSERLGGSPPTTMTGWRRMGSAFAQLAELDPPVHNLPLLRPGRFIRAHRERISELGPRLDPFVRSIPDWAALSRGTLPDSAPLALTHGDPGPGNYLHRGSSGSLIDWEEAHVAPLGLDLGRLIFIALLGSGPAGYSARDHEARAGAATAGYLSAVQQRWRPTRDEVRWWLAVAGIQFVHRRWQLGGPAPWEQAAQVLARALRSGPVNL
jgi:hypothetical protein